MFFLIIAVGFVSGCTTLGALNAVLPKDGNTREVIRDVSYGEHERQKLDIYLPEKRAGEIKKRPVVVFFYGGSWDSGSKREYGFVGRALNSKDYIAVLVDYRLVPHVRYPDFILDSAKAVDWVAENIVAHKGDPEHIFIAGHSAGAYNAMMVGLANQFYQDQGLKMPAVAGVIGLAGPYDFLPMRWAATREAFKGTEDVDATQPVNYLDKESPPLLLITGVDDTRVDPRHSRSMDEFVKQRKGRSELHTYPDVGHAGLLLSLAKPFRGRAPTLQHIDDFILNYTQ